MPYKDKEKRAIQMKKYAIEHEEKISLYSAQYYQDHKSDGWGRTPEESKEYCKKWNDEHREYFSTCQKSVLLDDNVFKYVDAPSISKRLQRCP